MPLVVIAAVAAGGAVAAGVIAASTVIYAGIAVSVVGKITKSKELSQIGSGMTLGAGLASAATSIFGAGEAAGASAAGAAGEMTAENAALGGADGLGGTGVSASAGSLGEAATGEAATTGLSEGITNGGEAIASAGESSAGLLNPAAGDTLAVTPPSPAVSTASNGMSAENVALGGADGLGGTGAIAPPVSMNSNSIAQWWAKQPESVKNRIMQTGGQAVGGLFDGWTSEQKLALQREQMNLTQQQYDNSVKNARAQPVVAFKPYTPPKTGGLLNPTAKG